MSRASTERKRVERKRAREIARLVDLNEQCATFLRAAAVHEAAHVIAAFHWDVPIGSRGVSITPASGGHDAVGFSDVRWATFAKSACTDPEHNAVAHLSWVGRVAAPFAEYQHRADDDNLDLAMLLSSCSGEFADVLGHRNPLAHDAGVNYGRFCFLLWMGEEKRIPSGVLDGETLVTTRDLVRDADAMLRAYWEQIVRFANALLHTDGLQMTASDVAQWRDDISSGAT